MPKKSEELKANIKALEDQLKANKQALLEAQVAEATSEDDLEAKKEKVFGADYNF